MATDMTVANEIWRQIDRFTKAACGARMPIGDADSLTFKVTISRGQDNRIKVKYNRGLDDYTVILYHIRGMNCTEVDKKENIGVEVLNSTIYGMCNK
jgi:hypothetical protein